MYVFKCTVFELYSISRENNRFLSKDILEIFINVVTSYGIWLTFCVQFNVVLVGVIVSAQRVRSY